MCGRLLLVLRLCIEDCKVLLDLQAGMAIGSMNSLEFNVSGVRVCHALDPLQSTPVLDPLQTHCDFQTVLQPFSYLSASL